jgi:mono/diheme cytochrome c family protein
MLAGAVLCQSLGAHADPLGPEHTAGVDLADPDVIEKGGEMFNGLCAGYCHGTNGTAKRGPALRSRPELDENTLHYTIVNGRSRGGNPMPAWGGTLSEEQIWTIIAYIVSLRDAPPHD